MSIREKIEKVISCNLSSLSLFAYWCNVYKSKEEYDKTKDNDLEVFARYLAKDILPAIKSELKEKLPKEKTFEDSGSDRTTLRRHGFNEALSQIKKIIEEA
jgi:hypothetical protein